MNPFLRTHTLALTPLSPIHIGCGEDFEPTNYIIEDGLLYGFDPSLARLTELQRKELTAVARRGALSGIQRFFLDNAAAFKPHAHVVMPVAKGVAQQYKDRIGKAANMEANGEVVFNKLEIERHVFTGPQQQPFIPGTSFKGALRTSWLDELNGERRPHDVDFNDNGEAKSTTDMENRLLDGDFQTSPLRLLKVADLMPVRKPERKVLFAVNRKKRPTIKDRNLAARKDCVLGGQYRLFQAVVTLPQLGTTVGTLCAKDNEPATPQRHQLNATGGFDLKRLAHACNAYHQQRLGKELDRHDLINPAWKQGIERLLAPHSELGRKLAAGDVFLVQIGRYGGAESKTLTGEGVASIKIMGARVNGRQQYTFESTTKTVWLAAQEVHAQNNLIPFGWAIVEIDPKEDNPVLKMWCEYAVKNEFPDVEKLIAQKAALEVERQAQAAKEAALAVMSLPQREMAVWLEKCEKRCHAGGKEKLNQGLHQEANNLVNKALTSPDWRASDKTALAEMLETWLPNIVAPWDAKEQRKKLKLSALRGVV